jgi:hypothetical protein
MLVVQVLFFGLFFAGLFLLATDRHAQATLKRYWKYILLALCLTLLWRVPMLGPFFHGMEYEDAYVYTVSARQIAGHSQIPGPGTPYLTTVCDVGSLDKCQMATTFSGHYIGSPYVFSVAAKIFGYTPAIGAWVGVGASCLTVILIFLVGSILSDEPLMPICAASVFAMTPVFAVYGIGSYAEPTSSLCGNLALYGWLRYVYHPPGERHSQASLWSSFSLWGFALLFSIIVKRENILIACVLPLTYVTYSSLRKTPNSEWLRMANATSISVLAILFSLVSLRFVDVLLNETSEYGHLPFGFTQARSLIPAFAVSFNVPSWYCFGLLWFMCGVGTMWLSRNRYLYPLFLMGSYLGVYVLHIRSYYQVNYNDVTPADALRYSINFMTMWSLLAGAGVAYAVRRWVFCLTNSRWRNLSLLFCCLFYGAFAYKCTYRLREQVTREEQRTRVQPSFIASKFAAAMGSADTYVITLEPLLLQIYGASNINVIDLAQMNTEIVRSLESSPSPLNILLLEQTIYQNELDANRYNAQVALLSGFSRMTLYRNDEFVILKLIPGTS